jgi:hypothetical protein
MLFHPRKERPTEPNAGILRLEPGGEILIVQYPGPTTGGRPIYDDRFNLQERRPVSAERIDR